MAGSEQRAKRYPTDLTDEEWRFVQPFLPPVSKRGRKPMTDLREVLDALRYLARTGGGWRMLPNDFPPWQTVYWWFRRFVRRLLFRTIHDVVLMLDRERENREQSPSAAVIDSLSIKAPAAEKRGFDAGKKIDGRKRHVAIGVDSDVLEIVRRADKEPGFKVLPRRWVVERTFGWMTRWKRLVRDYEQRLDVSEAMIHVALGSLMLRRIVHP